MIGMYSSEENRQTFVLKECEDTDGGILASVHSRSTLADTAKRTGETGGSSEEGEPPVANG